VLTSKYPCCAVILVALISSPECIPSATSGNGLAISSASSGRDEERAMESPIECGGSKRYISVGDKKRVLDTLKATDPATGKLYSLKAAVRLHKVSPFQIRQWRKQREQGKFETTNKSKKNFHSGTRPKTHDVEHDL
jgi:hypothetical protein